MGRRCEESVWKALVAVLAIAVIVVGGAGGGGGVVIAEQSNFKSEVGTRVDDTVNYTQMALNFVGEYYPDKNCSVFNSSVRIPYSETGFSYQQIEIDITPGASSPFDTVIVTIRHDTLNIEFGHAQYIQDYEEWYDLLPAYYKKMDSDYRRQIVENFGYLPPVTDTSSESYRANFTIYYAQANQSAVISYLKANKQNYSIVETNFNNGSYIIANMSLQGCLLTANQSYVQQVGINAIINFNPYVIDSWQYNPESNYDNYILYLVIIITIIGGFGYYIYQEKRKKFNKER